MNKKRLLTILVSSLLALVLLSACAKQAAPVAKAADYYKSNKITFLVASGPGAKTDLVARVLHPFYQAQTGGTVVVDNNGDAGGIVASNIVYTAKPDGLSIGVKPLGPLWGDFFGNSSGVQYDATKFRYLGAFAPTGYALMVESASPIRSIDDLKRAKNLKFAGQGAGSGYSPMAAVVIDALQLDAHIVLGYRGAADIYLALKSKEIDVMITGSAIAQGYYKQGTERVLFTIGTQRETAYFSDVPALAELVKLSPQHQNLVEFIEKALGATTSFYTAPGVSDENTKYLRGIFDKLSADKAAVDALTKALQIYTGYETGEETEKTLKRLQELGFNEAMTTFAKLVEKYRKK